MAKIVPKLNLNKTPQLADNIGLIFAKNIKLDKYGIIEGDSSVKSILDVDKIKEILNLSSAKTYNIGFAGRIVGINSKVYFFIYIKETGTNNKQSVILEYDEIANAINVIDSAWTYSGGEITGCVTNNNTNEYILTICEYNADKDVPIKHINLSKCSTTDDESIYTQTPQIPITNLILTGTYSKTIPNGVYMFFVRYKIREDFYTEWFPCSKECFAGTSTVDHTIQGSLKHIDTTKDSSESFIFEVQHLFPDAIKLYKEFQIGFILSHDDALVARSWKSFEFPKTHLNTSRDGAVKQTIQFDYDKDSIEEVDIDVMLRTNYDVFNVQNITPFKNKLYISNYKETDFNPDLARVAADATVELIQKPLAVGNKFIDGKELNDQQTEGYYTKWGDLDATTLYGNTKYFVSNKTTTKTVYKSNSPLYSFNIYLNQNVNPDVMWVNKADNHSNEPLYYKPLIDFDCNNNEWTEYFKEDWLSGNEYTGLYRDKRKHPYAKSALRGEWYFASNARKGPINERTENKSGIDVNKPSNQLTIYNAGFGAGGSLIDDTANKLANNVLNYVKNTQINKAIIYLELFVKGGNSIVLINDTNNETEANCLNEGRCFSNITSQQLEAIVENEISNMICGIDENGQFWVKDSNGNKKPIYQYTLKYADYEYNKSDISGLQAPLVNELVDITVTKTVRTITKTFNIDAKYIEDSGKFKTQYRSLMPFTNYEFYIHYVTKHGIATNGYLIDTKSFGTENGIPFDSTKAASIIYPKFNNITIPDGYVSYFISIYKTGDTVCQLFNVQKNEDNEIVADCLEADTLLEGIVDNIKVINNAGEVITNAANYYPSGTNNPEKWFGNNGTIAWKEPKVYNVKYNRIVNNTITLPYHSVYATNKGYLCVSILFNGIIEQFKWHKLPHIVMPICSDVNAFKTFIKRALTTDDDQYNDSFSFTFDTENINGTDYVIINVTTRSTNYDGTSEIGALGIAISQKPEIAKTISEQFQIKATATAGSYWISIPVDKSNVKPKRLTKLTPYLTTSSYDNYETLNSPGFLNIVYKTDKVTSSKYYCSGTDVYKVEDRTPFIKLGELYDTSVPPIVKTNYSYVLSNYPLNYLTLSEDITKAIKSIKVEQADSDNEVYERYLVQFIQTLVSSSIYELPHMYYDYNKKYYSVYDADNSLIKFDNTIRSSDINSDDIYRNIYNFNASDYYNVPTNRGIIINLFAINSNIYVHTEHSLYEFKGMNTFTTENGEAALKEGDVFDTGITDLFDSQFGFGGLQVKHHSLVTFLNYLFYDKLANEIYAYDSHSTPIIISNPIAKLMKNYNFTDVKFVADTTNDRIFINLIGDEDNVCLSYNTNVKSFVSIHDIAFDDAFNSRTNVYFIKQDTTNFNVYRKIDDKQNIYGNLTKESLLTHKDMTYSPHTDDDTTVESSVDIICNQEYDYIIKNLEYIQFVCNKQTAYQNSNICMAEDVTNQNADLYAGDKLRLYTDQGFTELINFVNANNPLISNNYNLLDSESYSKPRFNNGVWTFNYFRNIKYNSNSDKQYTQEDSLLHGKYVVARFVFSPKYKFKLENINFKINNYGKV